MNSPVGGRVGHRPFNRLMIASVSGMEIRSLARYAMSFAAAGADIRLVSIVRNPRVLFPTLPLNYSDWQNAHAELLRASEVALAEAKQEIERPGLVPETELLELSIHGTHTAQVLGEAAQRWDATLVAVAAQPRAMSGGWGNRLDPEDVAAMVRVPLLYVPAESLKSTLVAPGRILAAIDGSETALQALRAALEAVPRGALWRVVYVVDSVLHAHGWLLDFLSEDGVRSLEHAATLLKAYGQAGDTGLIETSPNGRDIYGAIALEADRWEAQLVVMGTRGRRAASRWLLGSVAERTLRSTSRPVLACPPVDNAAAGGTRQATKPFTVSRP